MHYPLVKGQKLHNKEEQGIVLALDKVFATGRKSLKLKTSANLFRKLISFVCASRQNRTFCVLQASLRCSLELLFDGTGNLVARLVYNELCHNELLFVTNNLIRKFWETTNENFVITQRKSYVNKHKKKNLLKMRPRDADKSFF